MELNTRNIHMKRIIQEKQQQITLEDDFNVPDRKYDVDRIITQDGYIEITEQNQLSGKVLLKGNLLFDILYISQEEGGGLQSIQGKIPFDDMIHMESLEEDYDNKVKCELEDLSISLINSRKISVRALLNVSCAIIEIGQEQVTVDCENENNLEKRFEEFEVTELVLSKKDIVRHKEGFRLPAGKPNINQIVYYDVQLQEMEIRNQDGQIMLRGDLQIFVLYRPRQDGIKLCYYEGEQSFSEMIPCEECKENMLLQLDAELQSRDIQAKADEDGEERVLEVDMAIGVDFSLYEKNRIKQLVDSYSKEKQLQIGKREMELFHLYGKSHTQKRVSEKIQMDLGEGNLQLCHCAGKILTEEVKGNQEEKILEGTLEVQILYIEEEKGSVVEKKISLPFEQTIEVSEEEQKNQFEFQTHLLRISASQIGKNQLDIKAEIEIEYLSFEAKRMQDIRSIEGVEFEKDMLEKMPEIVGYTVQKGDTLWSIAKEFLTTEKNIMELNQKGSAEVKQGEKILIGVLQ